MAPEQPALHHPRILVVDDEPDVRFGLQRLMETVTAADHVRAAANGEEAIRISAEFRPHVVVTDVNMPGVSGLELLRHVKANLPDAEVILVTGYATIPLAVEAMQAGTAHFLAKPFDNSELLDVVRRCARMACSRDMSDAAEAGDPDSGPVAGSPAMRHVMDLVDRVAPTGANVLLVGESGVGKEVIARAIYQRSGHTKRPFIPVNTAALPETLLESELFGHVRGAFTGATSDRAGIFRDAAGGTVFLDEVALMPDAFQGKLLRVLQERTVIPLGTSTPIPVDFRLIAATNRDLRQMIGSGEFREDLYYRLNVFEIVVPPLRDHRGDIPELATRFLRRFGGNTRLTSRALEALENHEWPGNVRELENRIHRAVILTRDGTIGPDELDLGVPTRANSFAGSANSGLADERLNADDLDYDEAKKQAIERFQRRFMEQVLTRAGGNLTHAAQICGLTRAAFRRIMNSLGLKREDFEAK